MSNKSRLDELYDAVRQCDLEIFALEERKRDLRRTIRIAKEAEKFEARNKKTSMKKEDPVGAEAPKKLLG